MPTITAEATRAGWGPSSYYEPSGSPYWVLNNDWNYPGPGTQSIDYNTSSVPNGTTINWNYGSHIAPSNVWGYPEVVYGTQGISFEPTNATHPANWGEQIGTLGHFNMTWDVSLTGNQNQYDVLAETHLSGHEFGIVLNLPPYMSSLGNGSTQHPFNLGGIQGEAIPNFWGSGSLALIPDSVENGTPMTHGSIDFAPILQWAISQGWLSSSDQLKGFALGIEAQQGAGSMTVNNLNYDWGPGSSTGASTGGSTGGSGGSSVASGGSITPAGGSNTGTSSGSITTTGGSGSPATAGGSSMGTVPPSSDPPPTSTGGSASSVSSTSPTTVPPSSPGDPSNAGSGAASGSSTAGSASSGSSTGNSSSSGSHHHHNASSNGSHHHHNASSNGSHHHHNASSSGSHHHHNAIAHHAHLVATLHSAHHASTASGDDSMANHLMGIHSTHHPDWS